ncbi:MAG: hypothetical protein ABJC09_09215 [Terriglobia bacterium]
MPFIASVEIDQRQNFIQQADTLREMVGASRMIGFSVRQAREDLKGFRGVTLFWPVSGVLRFYAEDHAKLGGFLVRYRRSLEAVSLGCSIAVLPTTGDLDHDLTELEGRIRARKDANASPVPIPSTPFFAPCSILPQLPATDWNPGAKEVERRLRSWQAIERESARNEALEDSESPVHIPRRRLAQIDQLVAAGDSRSYIGFIKGDVDGLGKLLTTLKFEKLAKEFPDLSKRVAPGLPPAAAAALVFTEELQSVLELAVAEAYRNVPAEKRPPNQPLPYRHLLIAGDDLFIIARRDIALTMAHDIEASFSRLGYKSSVIQAALRCAGAPRLSISLGVLFAKYGYPFDASFDLAEDLLRSAKSDGRVPTENAEGGIDFHWLGDSGRPRLTAIRRSQFFYLDDSGDEMHLTTLPWACSGAKAYLDAADVLRGVPRRKLKQLDEITRLGRELSDLAYLAWRQGLQGQEKGVDTALGLIHWPGVPEGGKPSLWRPSQSTKRRGWETCFNDLVQLTEVMDS